MTDADDTIDLGSFDEDEALFARLLAGADPSPGEPAWCHGVALLVRAAQAPAEPAELAGEDDIVQRMAAVRGARIALHQTTGAEQPPAAALSRSPADLAADPTGQAEAEGTGGSGGTVISLSGRASGGERHDRAQHAAARLEASRHSAVRTLGRVIAMKAAAATTVAVIGVAAAAAATTGIVATVVVPALSQKEAPTTTDPDSTTTTDGPVRAGGGEGSGTPRSVNDPRATVCPVMPTCTTEADRPTTPEGATAPTTVPDATPTTAADEDADEADAETEPQPTTTEPLPPTTTVPTTTTTTTTTTTQPPPPDDPPPGSTGVSPLSSDVPGPDPTTASEPAPSADAVPTSDPAPAPSDAP